MKIKKLLLVIATICLCSLMYGQTNQSVEKTIRDIRKEYNLVKSQIATLEKDGYAGELFACTLSTISMENLIPELECIGENYFFITKQREAIHQFCVWL